MTPDLFGFFKGRPQDAPQTPATTEPDPQSAADSRRSRMLAEYFADCEKRRLPRETISHLRAKANSLTF